MMNRRRIPVAFVFLLLIQSGCVGYNYKFKKAAASNGSTGKALEKDKDEATLIDRKGNKVSLSQYRGKNVLLIFNRGYPGYVCPYCTTYTAQIAAHKADFEARDAQIVLVYPIKSGDEAAIDEFVAACDDLLEVAGKEALDIPVYVDPELYLVKQFKITGDLSKPSAFILDKQGIVRYVYVGEDRKDRPSYKVLLSELDRVQTDSQ